MADFTNKKLINPDRLKEIETEARLRAKIFGDLEAREDEILRKLRNERASFEALACVLSISRDSPKVLEQKRWASYPTSIAYFFVPDNGDGVIRGFFKWEDAQCRPLKLFHLSAVSQIAGCRGGVRAVVLHLLSDRVATAQEFLVHFEEAPGTPCPYASRHGNPVEVPLDAFEIVAE